MTVGQALGFILHRRAEQAELASIADPPEAEEEPDTEFEFEAPPRPAGALSFGVPVEGRVTSGFGRRRHPTTGEMKDHEGVDIAAARGTPVVAASSGTVTFAGPRGTAGLSVILDHGDGIESRYGHLDSVGVDVGAHVVAGQQIGKVGSTGRSTGPHLHWEVRRNGKPIDPGITG